MEERLRELEQRVLQLETLVARLLRPDPPGRPPGITLPLPVRFVDETGTVCVELMRDLDGGAVIVCDEEGHHAVSLGSEPGGGGWLDIHHGRGGLLAISLRATDEGGAIEWTEREAFFIPVGKRYWPPEEPAA